MASRIGFVAFAAAMIAAGTAGAAGEPSSAEARLAWATRHVDLVCRSLETRGEFDKATRCYNDVARIVAETAQAKPAKAAVAAKPAVTAAKPAVAAAQPAGIRPGIRSAARKTANRVATARRKPATVVVAQAPARALVADARPVVFEPLPVVSSSRCQGISCLRRYTLLGVGF